MLHLAKTATFAPKQYLWDGICRLSSSAARIGNTRQGYLHSHKDGTGIRTIPTYC